MKKQFILLFLLGLMSSATAYEDFEEISLPSNSDGDYEMVDMPQNNNMSDRKIIAAEIEMAKDETRTIIGIEKQKIRLELEDFKKQMMKQVIAMVVVFLREELPGMVKGLVGGGLSKARNAIGGLFRKKSAPPVPAIELPPSDRFLEID